MAQITSFYISPNSWMILEDHEGWVTMSKHLVRKLWNLSEIIELIQPVYCLFACLQCCSKFVYLISDDTCTQPPVNYSNLHKSLLKIADSSVHSRPNKGKHPFICKYSATLININNDYCSGCSPVIKRATTSLVLVVITFKSPFSPWRGLSFWHIFCVCLENSRTILMRLKFLKLNMLSAELVNEIPLASCSSTHKLIVFWKMISFKGNQN